MAKKPKGTNYGGEESRPELGRGSSRRSVGAAIRVPGSTSTVVEEKEQIMQIDRDWTPPARDRSAHALPRREVLLAADARGIATIPAPRLARLAGVSTRTAWHWLRGQRVSAEMDRAIRAALNLPLRAA